jgi:hypothetical protein
VANTGDPVIREALRTLREAEKLLEENDGVPFRHTLSPPEEFRDPDLTRTKRLDREQEARGLDTLSVGRFGVYPTVSHGDFGFGFDRGERSYL